MRRAIDAARAAAVGAVAAAATASSARAQLRGRVVDAATGVGVGQAIVEGGAARTRSDALGQFELRAARGVSVRVTRIGYRPAVVTLGAGDSTVTVALVALVSGAVRLRDVATVGTRPSGAGRLTATVTADEARRVGATTLADAMVVLPFVAARSAQGSTVLSVRGARPEQVVVTLDGMPLNDPATGRADLADVPLAALGAMTVVPGADPAGAGPGASGGVLALASGTKTTASTAVGSFGARTLEGATAAPLGAGVIRVGAAYREADNDFRFVNREAATGHDTTERRVNADERSGSLFASAVLPHVQWTLLGTADVRGMAGPENVRAYDEDRGRGGRIVTRVAAERYGWLGSVAVRGFRRVYDDPRQPSNDFRAASWSGDAEVGRALGVISVRAGGGGDRAEATGLVRPTSRGRAYASAAWSASGTSWRASAALRGDAVGGAGGRVSPSASVERVITGGLRGYLRAAQAFRAPTLYDLYFSSPQRVIARPLRAERVDLDAETGVRAGGARADAGVALFTRRTRDAIVWFPGNFGWSPSNVAREVVRGAEARAAVVPVANPLGTVTLRGWAGLYDATLRVPRPGAAALAIPTPYVARASGGGAVEAQRRRGFVSATLQALGRRPFADAPASRSYELPGVALVNVRAGLTLGRSQRHTLVTAGVDNVGDAEWQSVRGYPTPGRSWSVGVTFNP